MMDNEKYLTTETQLLDLIFQMKFSVAEQLFDAFENEEKEEFVNKNASLSEDVALLGFLSYLNLQEETAENHKLLSMALCKMRGLEGAIELACYHAWEMIRLNPSIDNKVYMLYFNAIPQKPLPDEKAVNLAHEILAQDPDSQLARETIKRAEEKLEN